MAAWSDASWNVAQRRTTGSAGSVLEFHRAGHGDVLTKEVLYAVTVVVSTQPRDAVEHAVAHR